MLSEIQTDIIQQLSSVSGVATVGVWAGDVDELLEQPQRLPAVYVVFDGADYEPYDRAGDNTTAAFDFLVIVVARHLKSRADGAATAYDIIEGVRSALIGHQVGDFDFLRPVREDLITTSGGILVYGCVYRLQHVLI